MPDSSIPQTLYEVELCICDVNSRVAEVMKSSAET